MLSVLTTRGRYFIGLLGSMLLFLPKINLITVGNESAGIRVDDIIIGIFGICLTLGFLFNHGKKLIFFEFLPLIITTALLFSNVINLLYFDRSSLLYSLRFYEYFLFFYVGYFYAEFGSIRKLTLLLLGANCIVMALQSLDLIGGFTSAGATNSVGSRAVGLTGGPWEVGTCLNFFFGVLIFIKKPKASTVIFWFFFITFFIFLTGARMPLAANLAILFFWFFRKTKNKVAAVALATIVLFIMSTAITLIPNQVTDRSKNLSITDSFSQLIDAYSDSVPDDVFIDFPYVQGTEDGDLSWLIRASKWSIVVKIWGSNIWTWPFGVGPGTWGTALDGGWLRLFSEAGVIGGFLFILLFYKFSEINDSVKSIIIALYINMIMIDIEIAYKAMSYVFFACGYFYSVKNSSRAKDKILI